MTACGRRYDYSSTSADRAANPTSENGSIVTSNLVHHTQVQSSVRAYAKATLHRGDQLSVLRL